MLMRNPADGISASTPGIDPVLATIILELTDFRDAVGFFGPFLRNLTKDEIFLVLGGDEYIPRPTIVYLAKKW